MTPQDTITLFFSLVTFCTVLALVIILFVVSQHNDEDNY